MNLCSILITVDSRSQALSSPHLKKGREMKDPGNDIALTVEVEVKRDASKGPH